jgi:hypothetical protein
MKQTRIRNTTNLKIQVAHPPVAQERIVAIHGVVRGITDPINLLILAVDRQMGVADCKIGKNVARGHPIVEQIRRDNLSHTELA